MTPDDMFDSGPPAAARPELSAVDLARWRQARGELRGFANAMARGPATITAAQLHEALRMADESVWLRGEVDRLRQWVRDLQDGTWVTCVYCGHRYGPKDETPTCLADVLKEHVRRCPGHPLAAERQRADELEAQLVALADWCRARLGMEPNHWIGRDGRPGTLVGLVTQFLDRHLPGGGDPPCSSPTTLPG